MTNRPALPPVPPGRSALPAFLSVEAWARDELEAARTKAGERLAAARAKAEALRAEGQERLREAVLAGEKEALREVEDRAQDRVSDARQAVDQWISAAEARLETVVAEAVELLTRAPVPAGPDTAKTVSVE